MAKQEIYLEKITRLLAKYGAANFNTASLARRLAISPKTLYNNFGTYPEMLVALADYHFARTREKLLALASSPSQNAVAISFAALNLLSETSPLLTRIFLQTLAASYPETFEAVTIRHERLIQEFFALNIPRGRSETLYRPDFDTDLVASLVHTLLLELAQTQNPAEKRDQFAIFVLQGMATPLGTKELYALFRR